MCGNREHDGSKNRRNIDEIYRRNMVADANLSNRPLMLLENDIDNPILIFNVDNRLGKFDHDVPKLPLKLANLEL